MEMNKNFIIMMKEIGQLAITKNHQVTVWAIPTHDI